MCLKDKRTDTEMGKRVNYTTKAGRGRSKAREIKMFGLESVPL